MPNNAADALAMYVRRLLVRSPLDAEECAAVAALKGRVSIVQGDFVHIGDRVTEACLIVDGLAARFAQTDAGNRSIVALHIPGDMADLHSVVAPNVSWALHALTPTTILRVPHEAIRGLTARYPALALAFWRDCVADTNVLAQWMVNLGRKEALARVAHLLCEMSMRYDAIGLVEGSSFHFPIKQLDLADAVGLTPVHLNRVLKRLREEGLATKDLARVTIFDSDRLGTIAEFDPAYLQLDQDRRGTPDLR